MLWSSLPHVSIKQVSVKTAVFNTSIWSKFAIQRAALKGKRMQADNKLRQLGQIITEY